MMNPILSTQNSPHLLNLLRSSTLAYKRAKYWEIRITYFLIFLAVAYPAALFIFSNNNTLKLILFSFSFTLTVALWFLNPKIKGNTYKGAILKEEFDVLLFNLPRKSTITKPTKHEIETLSKNYKGQEIKNWYSPNISPTIPTNTFIALCQRTNTNWDIKLRIKYKNCLLWFIIIYSTILFFLFLYFQTTFVNIFLTTFCILGFYSHFITQYNGHKESIKKRKTLNTKLETVIINKQNISTSELRDIQDEIFITRLESAKVPNYFFQCFKETLNTETEVYIKKVNKIYNATNSS